MTTVCIVLVKGEPLRIYIDNILELLNEIVFKNLSLKHFNSLVANENQEVIWVLTTLQC